MTQIRSEFLKAVRDRGFLHQCTDMDALDARAMEGPIPAYIGFDATADSLHAGSLVPIMLLRLLQQTGHKPIVLMGGGTTKVGDPSGKDEARKMLTDADIDRNIAGIKKIFQKFLTFGDGPTDAVMVNNDDWLSSINYIAFLRDYGRHFSVNRMLKFDSVALRLEREQPLSFLEFNYMILQAYDFVELNRRHKVCLQMGGSDQWGNIVNGVELGRRTNDSSLYGLTVPLLTTASGAKMGKTASGAVWLNSDRLSAYDYWQYWRNTEDADVGRFLKLFTNLPLDEIARLKALDGAEINAAKVILANEATRLCHGDEAARTAEETAHKTFTQGTIGDDLPTIDVSATEIEAGIGVLEALTRAGLAQSNGDARRQIKGGAVRVNDEKVDDDRRILGAADVIDSVVKLSMGKKKHALMRVA
ncbi:MAG: tyrosine--tRNA ligase [Alphaproteobacteria bacterium]|nr:tyrosine--tRNA ligase [Alphaproteobacteria bacterium]